MTSHAESVNPFRLMLHRKPLGRILFAMCLALSGCGSPNETADVPDNHSEHSTTPVPDSSSESDSAKIGNWSRLYGDDGTCRTASDGIELSSETIPSVQWSRDIGTGYSAPVVRNDAVVVFHRQGDFEVLTCLKAASGDVIWEQKFPTEFQCDYDAYSSGPYSTPLLTDSAVFAISAEGTLRAMSTADGRLLWTRHLSDDFGVPTLGYGVGHSPILDDDALIINVGGTNPKSVVVALNPDNGETIWAGGTLIDGRSEGSYGTPVVTTIHGHRLMFAVTSAGLMCLSRTDGAEKWTIPFATHSRDTPNSTTPVVVDDLVMCSMFRANAFCARVDAEGNCEEVWENRRSIETCYNPITCVDGFVYGWHAFDRTFRCVELATGDVVWKQRSPFERGNHIAIGNQFLILGELGHVGCVNISTSGYEEVFVSSEPLLEGPCYTSPAYSRRRLFVRNERRLLCVAFDRDAAKLANVSSVGQ